MIEPLWLLERRAIIDALEYFGGNRTETAKALEISIRTMRIKIRELQVLGVDIPEANGKLRYGTPDPEEVRRPNQKKNALKPGSIYGE